METNYALMFCYANTCQVTFTKGKKVTVDVFEEGLPLIRGDSRPSLELAVESAKAKLNLARATQAQKQREETPDVLES